MPHYQEIGRAGRDGLPSRTILYYSYADVSKLRGLLEGSTDKRERLELQYAKLERIQQYAEANTCRRQILLHYFNETLEKPCGNCDVCRNPRQKIDGTIIAQKALSAVARGAEKVPLSLLIDVLRGSRSKAIYEQGLDKIKTYGAGADLSFMEWRDYLQQLINSGLLEIAYDERYALKLTERSRQVLKGELQVPLVKFVPKAETDEPQLPTRKRDREKAEAQERSSGLFEHLRHVRKQLADRRGMAPDTIFTDATLREMAISKPSNKIQMLSVTGVGAQKFASFGEPFINAVLEYVANNQELAGQHYGAPKIPTRLQTLDGYQKGLSPHEIASQRGLNLVTVYSHLADLYEEGHAIDLSRYLPDAQYQQVRHAINLLGTSAKLKELHEYLKGEAEYHHIRLSLARFKKEKRQEA